MNYNSQLYMQELQGMKDRIDSQMRQMQQTQMQQPQQPIQQPITQNFQIAPTQNTNELEGRYANNIDEVKNTFVVKTGIFVSKDYSNLWVKDVSGNIKTFKTEEIIEMDEKDKEISDLKKQIEELKGLVINATKYDNSNVNEQTTSTKPQRLPNDKRSNAK